MERKVAQQIEARFQQVAARVVRKGFSEPHQSPLMVSPTLPKRDRRGGDSMHRVEGVSEGDVRDVPLGREGFLLQRLWSDEDRTEYHGEQDVMAMRPETPGVPQRARSWGEANTLDHLSPPERRHLQPTSRLPPSAVSESANFSA